MLLWFYFAFPWPLMMIIFLCVSSSTKHLFKYLPPFPLPHTPFDFFLLSLESSLHVPGTSSLLDLCFTKMFLPICILYFHFLKSVFWRADVLNFNGVQFINCFYGLCFYCTSKKSLTIPRLQKCSPLFYSVNFVVLDFTFMSVFRFELMYILQGMDPGSFFKTCTASCASTFVSKALSPLHCLCPFVKKSVLINMDIFVPIPCIITIVLWFLKSV